VIVPSLNVFGLEPLYPFVTAATTGQIDLHRFDFQVFYLLLDKNDLVLQRGYAASQQRETQRNTPFSFRETLLKIHPLVRLSCALVTSTQKHRNSLQTTSL